VSQVSIAAESRTEFGKGAARRVRRAGQVPAVIYGHGQDPRHVALPGHDLGRALKTANVLLAVSIDGDSVLTLPRSVQRDPVRQTLEHVDLVIVARGERVVVDIPVTVVGRPIGSVLVDLQQPTIALEVEATHIPSEVVIDVEGTDVGHVVHYRDLVLPEGAALVADADAIVLTVSSPSAAADAADAAEAVEAAAAPSED